MYILPNFPSVWVGVKLEWIIKQLMHFEPIYRYSHLIYYFIRFSPINLVFIFHLKDHHFQPSNFSSFFSELPKSTTIQKWPQMLEFAQQASNTACAGAEDGVSQHQNERINQNNQWQPLKMTSPLSCVLFILLLLFQLLVHNYLKKFRMFLNTRKKVRVFWGEHSNISLALCSEFLLRVKKTN